MAEFKEILKHGANYLIANLATKALAFISIPVYTHLLSTDDFGMVNIFLGVAGILSSILTLCADQAVSRYYFDKKDEEDFKKFVGVSSMVAIVVFAINSTSLVLLARPFSHLTKVTNLMIYLLIPYTLINVIGLTYEQIYTPMRQSKKIAMSSLLRAYIGFSLAVGFILLFKQHKYLGQILGLLAGGLIMTIIWIKGISKYFLWSFDKNHLRYILKFSIPLIPYALSGVIIEQFGKIAIGSTHSISEAGFYSLALTISGLVGIVTAVTHQTWAPYYFEYMNAADYIGHDRDIDRIFRVTVVAAMGISTFGLEIGTILASKQFTSSLYLIPIFSYGFVFHQFSYVYMRNFSFVHKTLYSSIVVITAGIFNILLNIIVIPKFGEIGAATAFSLSYICMGFLAWWVNKYVIKCHGTPLITLLRPLCIYGLFSIPFFFIYALENIFVAILIKILLFASLVITLFWKDRLFISGLLKKNKQTPA